MTDSYRSRQLKKWALDVGFHRAGIARLGPPLHGESYLRWVEAGHHGSMAYLARNQDRRLFPASVFPGATTALCVALQYEPIAGAGDPTGDLWPRVSRYARGQDYHLVMEKRLGDLEERIRQGIPGTETRAYVDHGPVLERDLAARAGLGAVGKNTLLLHPEAGSWFFLGEIFLSLDLPPDNPMGNLCGRCRRCLDACPAGAFVEPYVLDSRRCISYWTIEHRGSIPLAMRHRLEGLVFGCDICQEVCPWNRKVTAEGDLAFDLAPERRGLTLTSMLQASPESYQKAFRRSAMKRAKREGLQRNTVVAMGNTRSRRYLPAVTAAFKSSPHPVVRGHAAWSLSRLGGRDVLRRALVSETDPMVRKEIDEALGSPGPGEHC